MATLTLKSTPIEDDKVPAPSVTPGLATTTAQEETIAAGMVPFVRKDDAAWDATKNKFSTLYKEVEKLTFDPGDIEGVGIGIEYRLTDYDILLAEALGLLESCLRARDDYHAKLAKAFDTLYQFEDFITNDAVHAREVKGDGTIGIYTVQSALSRADVESIENKLASSQNALHYYKIAQSRFSDTEIRNTSAAEQLLAFAGTSANREPIVWDGGPATPPFEHAASATAQISYRALWIQYYFNQAQIENYSGIVAATEASLNGARARLNWDIQDIEFKRQRTQAARDLAEKRIEQAVAPGGAYNYAEQLKRARRRLARGFQEASQRLTAAALGLKTILGYKEPLPGLVASELLSRAVLDDAYQWCRNATSFLSYFSRREQSYTQTLSLRRMFGDNFLDQKSWTFPISESLFPKQRHVRLKGINAFVVIKEDLWQSIAGTATDSFSALVIQAPDTEADSFYRLSDDAGTKMTVSQKRVPPVRIGRILTRGAAPYQEIYGSNVLRNVSPMGTWSFRLDHTGDTSDIDDIVIDLEIVSRFKS
jgi:hypothetical protein